MNLPHSIEAERTVLSCIVLDGAAYLSKALDYRITESWFYHRPHVAIWKTLMGCHAHGKPLDAHIVLEELKKSDPKLDSVGGVAGYSEATAYASTGVAFSYSLDQLRELYQLRQIALISEETREAALVRKASMDDFVAKIGRVLALKNATNVCKSLSQAATDCIGKVADILAGKETEENSGLEWPWQDWNKEMGQAAAGELIIVAARPGRGKSSCARQVAWHWAQKYGNVLLFSREMPIEQLAPLFAQIRSGVSWRNVRRNQVLDADAKKFTQGLKEVSELKTLSVFDQDRTLSQITARVEACKTFMPVKAIIVDYLQRYDPQQERGETRDIAIGRMTMALKDLAVSLKIPVILLAQLGREVEKENRQPRLSDLRESGNIEQDADRVIFIHAPDEKLDGSTQDLNDQSLSRIEVNICQAKGRSDGVATLTMSFHRPTTTFHAIHRST
jgi:replicative DNA helicase